MNVLKRIFQNELTEPNLESDKQIYQFLIKKGINREEIIEKIEKTIGVHYFRQTEPDGKLISRYDALALKTRRAIPIQKQDKTVYFLVNQLENQSLREALKNLTHQSIEERCEIKTWFLLDFELEEWLERVNNREFTVSTSSTFSSEPSSSMSIGTSTSNPPQESTPISDNAIMNQANHILEKGVRMEASDIHFEPIKKGIQIRYRVDGILSKKDYLDYSPIQIQALTNRLKIISGMDVGKKREPQDGRIESMFIDDEEYNVRVSSVATIYGEKIVFRLFKKNSKMSSFEQLGFSGDQIDGIKGSLNNSNGIILLAGSTGSGKSTTMHTMVGHLDSDLLNIYTIEDPVEKTIDNVNQIPIEPMIGVTFAEVLRTLLRQDPDVIVVGEIRDKETAELAIKASLTGHLVISTIHANNSHDSIERLLNMDLEAYQLAAGLRNITSQRLARVLCSHCKVEKPIQEHERETMKSMIDAAGDTFKHLHDEIGNSIHHAVGCERCNQIGYKGRTLLAESLQMTSDVQDRIAKKEPGREILKHSIANGFKPLEIHAIEKIIKGETSLEEVLRVV